MKHSCKLIYANKNVKLKNETKQSFKALVNGNIQEQPLKELK
jgi:hypothetical protein